MKNITNSIRKTDSPVWKILLAGLICIMVFTGRIVVSAADLELEDGEYAIEVTMTGGSGKASIETPTLMYVKDGKFSARIRWSSSNYDYMIVDGTKYLNMSEENQNSVFEIPILTLDEDMKVIADTLAMGTPHEVEYAFHFYSESIGSKSQLPQESAKRVLIMAAIIIVGGGILNHYVKKKRKNDFNGK